jgi:hypothetical protein
MRDLYTLTKADTPVVTLIFPSCLCRWIQFLSFVCIFVWKYKHISIPLFLGYSSSVVLTRGLHAQYSYRCSVVQAHPLYIELHVLNICVQNSDSYWELWGCCSVTVGNFGETQTLSNLSGHIDLAEEGVLLTKFLIVRPVLILTDYMTE